MSEPVRHDRVVTGLYTLLVISILVALSYALKKSYWKDVH
jgi:cytochrome c1